MPGPQLLYRGAIACPVILSRSAGVTPVRTRCLSRAVILSVHCPGATFALCLVAPVRIVLSLSVVGCCMGLFIAPLSSVVSISNALGIHIYLLSLTVRSLLWGSRTPYVFTPNHSPALFLFTCLPPNNQRLTRGGPG